MKKLAIVSTYDELCGIAGYTRALEKQLAVDFEVTVFDLDQYFMRSTHPKLRLVADRMIEDFALRFAGFDCVNIQLEHGTLGATHRDIVRRLAILLGTSQPLTITFHTIFNEARPRFLDIARLIAGGKLRTAWHQVVNSRRLSMNAKIMRLLRKRQKRARTSVVVHTRRDARMIRSVQGIEKVFDHPLAFYDQATVPVANLDTIMPSRLRGEKIRRVGVFGFLSEYKGIDTAIKAMRRLPDDYHLLIFGGVHPNSIAMNETINPYVKKLMTVAEADLTMFDTLSTVKSNALNLNIASLHEAQTVLHDISRRVHFLGVLNDEGFAVAMQQCDVVVLPYLETGQSSSGPMSIAVDVGARVVAARNKAFLQYARYNPDRFKMFEIGNHAELADRILDADELPLEGYDQVFNTTTNRAVYRAALLGDAE